MTNIDQLTADLMILEDNVLNPLDKMIEELNFYLPMVQDETVVTMLNGYLTQMQRDFKTYTAIKNKLLGKIPDDPF